VDSVRLDGQLFVVGPCPDHNPIPRIRCVESLLSGLSRSDDAVATVRGDRTSKPYRKQQSNDDDYAGSDRTLHGRNRLGLCHMNSNPGSW